MKSIYIIGSLRNQRIPEIGNAIRQLGIEAFDDWYAAGPEADDRWKEYEQGRGRTYGQALEGHAANHVFEFDKFHLDRVDAAVLVMPAGKSGCLELGYVTGKGKPTFVLYPDGEPDARWDVMMLFASGGVFFDTDKFVNEIRKRS